MTKYHAAIETNLNGKMVRMPVFASKKKIFFSSLKQAIRKLESKKMVGRGFVYPSGTTLADADWNNIYTVAL